MSSFITNFSVLHNNGSIDGFSNQCMLISIYDHLRIFKNFELIIKKCNV